MILSLVFFVISVCSLYFLSYFYLSRGSQLLLRPQLLLMALHHFWLLWFQLLMFVNLFIGFTNILAELQLNGSQQTNTATRSQTFVDHRCRVKLRKCKIWHKQTLRCVHTPEPLTHLVVLETRSVFRSFTEDKDHQLPVAAGEISLKQTNSNCSSWFCFHSSDWTRRSFITKCSIWTLVCSEPSERSRSFWKRRQIISRPAAGSVLFAHIR